jgi:hypothetical protein
MKVETRVNEKARSFSPALNAAVKDAVKKWHKEKFPGHFQTGASRKYGYQTRSGRYQNRKRKIKGSAPALVYSGYSRRILGLFMRVTGTKGNVTGRFTSNQRMKYFWMRKPGHPDKASEMKILTDKDVADMSLDIRIGTVSRMESIKARKKTR